MKKATKIILSVVSILLVLIILSITLYFIWPTNRDFFDSAKEEFDIPGLDEGFVPQSITYIDNEQKYLIGGYMLNGDPSRFYIVKDNNVEKYFTLKYNDNDYNDKISSVLSKGNTIWILGSGKCYSFKLSKITNVKNGESVEALASFNTLDNANYIYSSENYLWIGEYYSEGKSTLIKSHTKETRSGGINHSLAFCYQIDESRDNGLLKTKPIKAISVTDDCVAMDFAQDNSIILIHANDKTNELMKYKSLDSTAHDKIIIDNNYVDLWYLDDENFVSKVNIPSMSSDLLIKDNCAYLLFNSGSKIVSVFHKNRLKKIYSISLDTFAI